LDYLASTLGYHAWCHANRREGDSFGGGGSEDRTVCVYDLMNSSRSALI
jgi:hypothetical protein